MKIKPSSKISYSYGPYVQFKKNFPISDTKKRIFINAAIICYVEKLMSYSMLCLIQLSVENIC